MTPPPWNAVRALLEQAQGLDAAAREALLAEAALDAAVVVEVLQRFAQERQALARLSHPHIARLLDAGASEDGLPYFVMEYVDGKPIHEASSGLTLEQRLRLFLQLADAVAYAHRNLLVHRDLKPGNVLVDAEGAVKLLDFGIAKALDPQGDGHTTFGGVRPYTPNYASPEQVRGEPVTTATDIYSLGVLLYEMLTGTRPTGRRATTPAQAARCVLEEEPTRPSRLSPADAPDPRWLTTRSKLEGDLDNILLKALDKSSERRYASVDALAADISAYLEGRPVSARAASVGYVLSKFLRRNRWAALTVGVGGLGLLTALAATVLQGRAAAALGVLALAAGLLMALVQARQAALSRDEAARARDDARQQLGRLKRVTTDLVFRYGDTVALLPGGAKAQEALLRESVASLEPALQGAPADLDLVTTMVSALGRLAEIQGNTTVSSPASAADARATVASALALAERANMPSLKRPADALREYGLAERVLRELLTHTDLLEQLDRNAAPGDASSEAYLLTQIGTILGGRALMHLQHGRALAANARPQEALDVLAVGLRHWQSRLDPADGADAANARRRVAWHQVQSACALAALGQGEQAAVQLRAAVRTLAELTSHEVVGRDAQLTQAEAHALLCELLPAEADTHRRAAAAALRAAQSQR